jgi:hypothetical protein
MTHTPPEGITYEQWRQILKILGSGQFIRLEFHPLDRDDVLTAGIPGRKTRACWGMTVTWDEVESTDGCVDRITRMSRTTAFPITQYVSGSDGWCAPEDVAL